MHCEQYAVRVDGFLRSSFQRFLSFPFFGLPSWHRAKKREADYFHDAMTSFWAWWSPNPLAKPTDRTLCDSRTGLIEDKIGEVIPVYSNHSGNCGARLYQATGWSKCEQKKCYKGWYCTKGEERAQGSYRSLGFVLSIDWIKSIASADNLT